ncbi:MAG: GAF domain-containing protein [Sphingomonadaceae bacterium]|nr:GAF domain-containing protein [Sphingomonadaceae bacterium]
MQDSFASDVAALGDDPPIRAILEDVCRITKMGFAAVARVTEARWIACQVLDKIEFGLNPGDELKIKTTICDDIRGSGEAIVIDSVADDFTWRTHPTPIIYGFKSYASFPLYLDDGSFFGTLCAIDPEPHELSTSVIAETLQAYAKQIGTILSRASAGKVAPAPDLRVS